MQRQVPARESGEDTRMVERANARENVEEDRESAGRRSYRQRCSKIARKYEGTPSQMSQGLSKVGTGKKVSEIDGKHAGVWPACVRVRATFSKCGWSPNRASKPTQRWSARSSNLPSSTSETTLPVCTTYASVAAGWSPHRYSPSLNVRAFAAIRFAIRSEVFIDMPDNAGHISGTRSATDMAETASIESIPARFEVEFMKEVSRGLGR
jgi:hypothetical protein